MSAKRSRMGLNLGVKPRQDENVCRCFTERELACLWTTPKTCGNYPALINKHFSLLADVVARAISSSSHGEEATLKCLRSEQNRVTGVLELPMNLYT